VDGRDVRPAVPRAELSAQRRASRLGVPGGATPRSARARSGRS
jgi:hypothetical protein